jgi:hypothetical protein
VKLNLPPTTVAAAHVFWCAYGWTWFMEIEGRCCIDPSKDAGVSEFPNAFWAISHLVDCAEDLGVFLTRIDIEPLDFDPVTEPLT